MGSVTPLRKRRLIASTDLVKDQLVSIRADRQPSVFGREERLTILQVYFSIYNSSFEQNNVNLEQPFDTFQRTGSLTGRGRITIVKIVAK